MATHAQVLYAGVSWVASVVSLIVLAFVAGLIQWINNTIANFGIHPLLLDSFNTLKWIPSYVWVLIVVWFIVSTIWLYYALVRRNDYYPELGQY